MSAIAKLEPVDDDDGGGDGGSGDGNYYDDDDDDDDATSESSVVFCICTEPLLPLQASSLSRINNKDHRFTSKKSHYTNFSWTLARSGALFQKARRRGR